MKSLHIVLVPNKLEPTIRFWERHAKLFHFSWHVGQNAIGDFNQKKICFWWWNDQWESEHWLCITKILIRTLLLEFLRRIKAYQLGFKKCNQIWFMEMFFITICFCSLLKENMEFRLWFQSIGRYFFKNKIIKKLP